MSVPLVENAPGAGTSCRQVKSATRVPVSVKLSPNAWNIAGLAAAAGAEVAGKVFQVRPRLNPRWIAGEGKVAEIARDKAYTKLADRLCWDRGKKPFNDVTDADLRAEIDAEVKRRKGGLIGSRMVSDAFFPFRDGIDAAAQTGIVAVIQPGGSDRDFESIEACNEANVAMVYTGQRSFRH